MLVMMLIVMLASGIMVFMAYREGIRTGLSLNNSKLPPITPKAVKEEKEAIVESLEEKKKMESVSDQLSLDIAEALNYDLLSEVDN